MSENKGLILDRDGIVNVDIAYLHRIEDCVFVDGIFDLTRRFTRNGFSLAIATNQAGIGRGYYSEAQFWRLMDWIKARFADEGVSIAAIYHCPDHPTEGVGVHRRENSWRKPGPGMFLQAIADLGLDPQASWAIGDKPTDMAAAAAAGIGYRVLVDPDRAAGWSQDAGHWTVPDLPSIHPLLDRNDAPA